jgi:hypothetical protein
MRQNYIINIAILSSIYFIAQGEELCSSQDYPIALGATDGTVSINCIAQRGSNTILGGHTTSDTFSGSSGIT